MSFSRPEKKCLFLQEEKRNRNEDEGGVSDGVDIHAHVLQVFLDDLMAESVFDVRRIRLDAIQSIPHLIVIHVLQLDQNRRQKLPSFFARAATTRSANAATTAPIALWFKAM